MKYAVVSIFILFISGCDNIKNKILEESNKGTAIGLMYCIKTYLAESIDEKTAKIICSRKHENVIFANIKGTAGYHYDGGLSFSGRINNTSDNIIVTKLKINVYIKPEYALNNLDTTESFLIEDLWLTPKQTSTFAHLSDIDKIINVNKIVSSSPQGFDWEIASIFGVPVE